MTPLLSSSQYDIQELGVYTQFLHLKARLRVHHSQIKAYNMQVHLVGCTYHQISVSCLSTSPIPGTLIFHQDLQCGINTGRSTRPIMCAHKVVQHPVQHSNRLSHRPLALTNFSSLSLDHEKLCWLIYMCTHLI